MLLSLIVSRSQFSVTHTKSFPTDALRITYKELCTKVKRLISESRAHFFDNITHDLQSNPKRLWSIFKQKNKCSTVPESVSLRTTESNTATVCTASCPHDIAELFNNYFASVLNSDDDHISTGIPSSTTEKESGLSKIELTTQQVLVALLNLDTRKATGPDKKPPRLLKETAHQIAPSLCLLFNQSLKFGTLPEEWKLANIIPVYKKGEKKLC